MSKRHLKTILKWFILGGVFFFLLQALRANWQEIAAIRITAAGWSCIIGATGMTLCAHIWSGWVWGWILAELNHTKGAGSWSVITYLKTNVAKYLPGNVWHFYGRVMAAKAIGIPLEASTVSVIMEALLMAAAALLVGLLSSQQLNLPLQLLCLMIGLMSVHPRVLNPILKQLKGSKLKSVLKLGSKQPKPSHSGPPNRATPHTTYPPGSQLQPRLNAAYDDPARLSNPTGNRISSQSEQETPRISPIPNTTHPLTSSYQSNPQGDTTHFPNLQSHTTPNHPPSTIHHPPSTIHRPPSTIHHPPITQLKHYPLIPLLGELGFLGLRSLGFIGVVIALTPIAWSQFPAILSGFSLAWMLGLVIPGAPGGIGVFEATAIALLGQSTTLSPGLILSAVALYRLVSTLAEAIGAGVAWLDERRYA